jgi:tetratricopeptide (TPR) repeat protein
MRAFALILGALFGGGAAWIVHGPGAAALPHPSVDAEAMAALVARAPLEPPPLLPPAPGGAEDATTRGLAVAEAPAPAPQHEEHDPVRKALRRWAVDGRARPAAEALRAAGAGALAEAIERIDSLRRAGRSALLDGDLEVADARWSEAMRREEALGLEETSRATREMRARLASAWHERALLHEARGQIEAARALWERAIAIDPAHIDSLAGLQRLGAANPAAGSTQGNE